MKNISEQLRNYLGVYRYICTMESKLEKQIKEFVIEEQYEIGAAVSSGMPHGTDISNPTANKALHEVSQLEELIIMENELSILKIDKAIIENEMIGYINEKELSLIQQHCVLRMTLEMIAYESEENLNNIKAILYRSLNKLEKLFTKNV
jgi:hypothetical protein